MSSSPATAITTTSPRCSVCTVKDIRATSRCERYPTLQADADRATGASCCDLASTSVRSGGKVTPRVKVRLFSVHGAGDGRPDDCGHHGRRRPGGPVVGGGRPARGGGADGRGGAGTGRR